MLNTTYTVNPAICKTICFQWIRNLQHHDLFHQVSESTKSDYLQMPLFLRCFMKMYSCALYVYKVKCIGNNMVYRLLQQVWVADPLTHQLSNSVTLFHCTEGIYLKDDQLMKHISEMQPFHQYNTS